MSQSSNNNNTSTNNKENGNNSRNFRPSKQRKQKENPQKILEGNKNGEYAQGFYKIVEKKYIPQDLLNKSFAGCSSSNSKIPSKNIKVITPTRQQKGNKAFNKYLQKDETKIEFSKKKNSNNFQQQNGGKINNQNKWSNQNGSHFNKNIQNNYSLIRQSPTSLLRPLKEELKIDGKSSEFKPLLYGCQFNSSPVIPPDVNCSPRRRRHRPRNSIPAEINGNTLSGNEGEVFTRSLVGVILKNSLEENKLKNGAVNNWAEFLVYQDSKASFNSIIRLQADEMLFCISPGSWLLVILKNPINYKTLNFDTILVPKKVVFCRHRFMTSCFDGQVSFFVTATLRRDIISGDKNKFVYHSRLCNLFIDKEELIDPLIKMFGNNSEKEENDIPIKIRLWCFPFIQNNNCQLKFKLKQIDERYYAKINSTENEEESNDENSDFNIGEEKQLLFSTNFCNWFSECIERFYIKNKMNNDRKIKMDKFVNLLNKKLKNNLDLPNEAKLILFGSPISGFGSNDCDLDICLINCGIDSSLNPSIFIDIRLNILSQIGNLLRKDDEFGEIILLRHARTPILKFKHLPTNFNCEWVGFYF
uniref:Polymerase nucleotidyl transferase domain-containing protein n=1 Tax=Meloidogyne incognita TaxID=6306 RepID=A0A914MAL4_MELIC